MRLSARPLYPNNGLLRGFHALSSAYSATIRIIVFLRTVILMNSLEQLQEAEQALLKIFSGIDHK
ncbi:MAG: hypothetical protein AAFX46_10500, partial [Cyanobacteria bacterium J06636_27]